MRCVAAVPHLMALIFYKLRWVYEFIEEHLAKNFLETF